MSIATDVAELFVYQTIGRDHGEVNADDFTRQLNDARDVSEINVRINSEGGSVFEAFAIHSALLRCRARGQRVVTWIDGIALSGASVIATAGDPCIIIQGGAVLVHGARTMHGGTEQELRKSADLVQKINSQLVEIYVAKTKKPREVVEQWVAGETWFTSSEAMAAGLVDKYSTESPYNSAALFDIRAYKVPDRILNATRGPIEAELTDLEIEARIAVKATAESTFDSFRRQAFNRAEKLTKTPGVTGDDLRRAQEALERITAAENFPRE